MSVWQHGNKQPDPKILAAAASDDPGCGKVFNFSLCRMKHLYQKERERRGLRDKYEPCAYCPKIIEALAKPMSPPPIQEEPEPMKTEPEKVEKKRCGVCANWLTKNGYCHSCAATARAKKGNNRPTAKTGVIAICIECKDPAKIAAKGLCWKCYNDPEIKNKYKSSRAAPGKTPAVESPKIPVSTPGVGECFNSAAEANPWPPAATEAKSPQDSPEEECRCPSCGKPMPTNRRCPSCFLEKLQPQHCRHMIGLQKHHGPPGEMSQAFIGEAIFHDQPDPFEKELELFAFCPICGKKMNLQAATEPWGFRTTFKEFSW